MAECVTEAAARRTPLSITGLESKAALGRPMKNAGRLDLSRLNGITFYESGELVFSALAGTPIETIETMLAKNARELAFEPMSFAALYGTGRGTIGGAIMANLSGPRRIKAGATRAFEHMTDAELEASIRRLIADVTEREGPPSAER